MDTLSTILKSRIIILMVALIIVFLESTFNETVFFGAGSHIVASILWWMVELWLVWKIYKMIKEYNLINNKHD